MTRDISSLQPRSLFSRFSELCSIPRTSGHESTVAEWIAKFAKEHSLPCRTDEAGNVIINAPASEGLGNKPGVILQAHMDMVPASDAGVSHDFLKDPIEVYEDNGWLKARGTSLGADDGLGLCTILALLDDPSLKHGPITAIFTVEEETTMKGALAITKTDLKDAEYLINLDSEDSGYVFTGCAGSCDADIRLPLERVQTPDCSLFKLTFTGFLGGHSGSDIALGRANAIKFATQTLLSLSDDFEFFISSIEGGRARNAIPSSCDVTVNVPNESVASLKKALSSEFEKLKSLYTKEDPEITLKVTEGSPKSKALSAECSIELLNLLNALPSGALSFHDKAKTLTMSSCNLGSVILADDSACMKLMPRSLTDAGLNQIVTILKSCAELSGAVCEFSNYHDCWLSPSDSTLVEALSSAWSKVSGSALQNAVIHAGLECARFHTLCPDLQMASIGSTIISPHSPRERAEIKGAVMVYETLRLALASLSE
ncbi:MAG: beta-Ala-His dipeptidase [Succinatimonas hippei]|nr:beta-Ala-His dipeptidase [Succinatimonas hippei]